MDFLEGLNPQQRDAVVHIDGPVLILAGAGSGKTRVITHRIAHIIRNHHVPGSAVLAVTFTNKAAQEMRARVMSLLEYEPGGSGPGVSTFHSFCVRLLRRDGAPLAAIRLGFNTRFSIYDEDDQLLAIKAAYRHLGLEEKNFMQYRAALSRISHAKNLKKSPQDFYRDSADPQAQRLAVVFEEYEKTLRNANALDFDDLLLETVRLLYHDETTRQMYNRRLSHLMIDEYQDTNRSQYELIRLLSTGHSNVCVVGDEDQSIYSWRGADIRNILDFERDYPNALVIRLEQNYRSTKTILEAASTVVANNQERKGKWLWTESGAGERVGQYSGYDGENEALFIADTIERWLSSHPGERVAVLYRTNFQSRQIEEALRRYGRKYLVVGGTSFYQRAEVKDALAYLKLGVSTRDSASLLRIVNTPARGIGKTTVEQVERYASQHGLTVFDAIVRMLDGQELGTRAEAAMAAFRGLVEEIAEAVATQPLAGAIRFIIERTGYREMLKQEDTPEAQGRLENLGELLNAAVEAGERGESASDFLDHAALVADADSIDERALVTLMTMHNAKGLEFPLVIMAGMEEGLFPHSRSFASKTMLEEERRLCYVGMTRAEKRLIQTSAKLRRRFGGGQQEETIPSRFLREVPENLTVKLGEGRRTPQVDLSAERHEVRESARRNTYTGKTYNSLDNISQFFSDRGRQFPQPGQKAAGPPQASPVQPSNVPQFPSQAQGARAGTVVEHPKYGTGTVLRREGDGEDAKLTINFPGHGLKKLIAKYATIKRVR
ncbi:MAG: UvrD-helicase domain-containing protein [Bryobacteraceae bacterium]